MKKIFIALLFSFGSLFAAEHLTIDNFEEKIEGKNVIVDFYATWCPPCKIMSKNLEKFEKENTSDVIVYKVDVDDQPILASRFAIKTIPTLVYFKNGKFVKKDVGIRTVSQLKLDTKNSF